MRYWLGITDEDWASYLGAIEPPVDEVNFWHPGGGRPITLSTGDLWVFKRKVSLGGEIVGGAWYVHWSQITPTLAWDAFGVRNGTATSREFYEKLRNYRKGDLDPLTTLIGASVLTQPFFLPRDLWIAQPADWSANLMTGKSYDSEVGEGRRLWDRLQSAIRLASPIAPLGEVSGGRGAPRLVRPRIGQGAFRVLVTDAYERRCAVTGERTLPVLEAAHIKPFSIVQEHDVSNGLLLRADLHRLFDLGYVTVNPTDRRFEVSRRINEQFENGKDYYALAGQVIRSPRSGYPAAGRDALEWHAENVFLG